MNELKLHGSCYYQSSLNDMKIIVAAFLMGLALTSLISCEKKSEPERVLDKVENKVDDALDRRPGEKVLDAAENISDKVKDATN